MTTLYKTINITRTPTIPGDPGYPGSPATPEHWVKTCPDSSSCRTVLLGYVPVYGYGQTIWEGNDGLSVGQPPILYYARMTATICSDSSSISYVPPSSTSGCTVTYYPETAAVPPRDPIPPTPSQLSTDFQEGWNCSAQSIEGVLPGYGFQFTIMNGTRGLLVCAETEQFTPNINTPRYGIMFNGGGFTGYPSNVTAVVWENGVLRQQLGTFVNGQTFVIGRATNNRIVYRNSTQSIQVINNTTPAPSTVRMHLFSQMYMGGDTIYA